MSAIFAISSLCIGALIGFLGQSSITVFWPSEEREVGSRLTINGQEYPLASSDITRIRLPAGSYSLRLERPGFDVVQQEIAVSWGSHRQAKADWRPNTALRTQRTLIELLNAWPAVIGRTAYAPLVGQLRNRIRQFRNQDLSRLHQAIAERLESSLPNMAALRPIDFPEQSIPPNTWTLSEPVYRHAGSVSVIQFAAEGKLLATAGLDGRVCLWNMSDGGLVAKRQSDSSVTAMYFVHSNVLAIGEANGRVVTWDFMQNSEFQYESQRAGVISIACSPKGAWLAAGAADNKLRIWRSGRAEPEETIPFTHQVCAVAWSEDGNTCAGNDLNGLTKLISLDESDPIDLGKGPPAQHLYFSDNRLVAFGRNRVQAKWSLEPYSEPETSGKYPPLSVGKDGSRIVEPTNIGRSPAIRVPEIDFSLQLNEKAVVAAYTPKTRLVALGYANGSVEVYSTDSKDLRFGPKPDFEHWTSLAISSDHSKLATGAKSGRVVLWDLFDRQPIDEFQSHVEAIEFMAFSKDDRQLISHAGETLSITQVEQTSVSQSLSATTPITFRATTNEVAYRSSDRILVRKLDSNKEVSIPILTDRPVIGFQAGGSLFGVADGGRLVTLDCASGIRQALPLDKRFSRTRELYWDTEQHLVIHLDGGMCWDFLGRAKIFPTHSLQAMRSYVGAGTMLQVVGGRVHKMNSDGSFVDRSAAFTSASTRIRSLVGGPDFAITLDDSGEIRCVILDTAQPE